MAESTFVGLHGSETKKSDLFRELDVLRNAEGMKAVISQRISNGTITFAIVREFTRDGKVETTGFIPLQAIDAFADMLELVKKRCAELEKGSAQPVGRNPNGHKRTATGK